MYAIISTHAEFRMNQRGICQESIELVLEFGRQIYARRAIFYVVGKKEIARYSDREPKLKLLEGLQVISANDGTILTAYKNKNLRGIRPVSRQQSHLH